MPTSDFSPSSARLPAELLERYFLGQCAPDEHARVEAAMAAHPGLRVFQRTIVPPVADVETMWARFASETLGGDQPATSAKPARRAASLARRFSWTVVGGMAAAFVVIIGGAWMVVDRMYGGATGTPIRYVTARAEHRVIALPDGSRAVMAPMSELRYANTSRDGMQLALTGEAHFTVPQRARRAFTVRTGNITTRVLGTAFTVRRYENDSVTQVAVITGKVATGTAAARAVIVPGTIGYVTDSSAIVVRGGNVQNTAAWATGKLVFDKTPVREMLRTAGRWYGYEFQLADSSLAAQHVTLVLNINAPSEAIDMIRKILDVRMTFKGDTVVLQPAGNIRRSPVTKPLRDIRERIPMEVGK